MKSRFQTLWLCACSGALLLVAMGCNDTLRQFITPIPPPTGDPGALSDAIVLSTNPAAPGQGSNMHIDVSGDSSVGIVTLGLNPAFLGKVGNRVFAINKGDGGATPPTVSSYIGLLPATAAVATVTLPTAPSPDQASNPVGAGTSSAGNIYVANHDSNNISVISGSALAVTLTIPLPAGDTGPVMVAGNASNNQIFVVNQGSGTVTQISTIDNTIVRSIGVGASPIWGVMSSDGLFVFIVNQGGNSVSVIDASVGNVIAIIPVGTSPNFAFYESSLRRVYVSNTGSNTVSVINANGISAVNLPTKLKDIAVAGAPTSVTALSDGSKAYAALGNCTAGVNHVNIIAQAGSCNGNLVSVIDAVGLVQTGTLTVGPGAISIAASNDATKVFVISAHDITTIRDNVHAPNCTGAACLPGPPLPDRTFTTPSITTIRTSTNQPLPTPADPSVVSTPLPTFHVPQQVPTCVPTIDPNFNSTVPMPCALQNPFVVGIFP